MTLSWSFSDDRCSIRKTLNAITPITPGSPTNHLPDMVAWPCCQTIPKVTLNWFYTHPTGEEKHSCDMDPEPNLPCLKRRGAIFSPSNTPGVLDDPIPLSCRRQEDPRKGGKSRPLWRLWHCEKLPPGVEKLDQNMELYTAPNAYLSRHGISFPKSRQLPWAKHKTTLLSRGLMMDDSAWSWNPVFPNVLLFMTWTAVSGMIRKNVVMGESDQGKWAGTLEPKYEGTCCFTKEFLEVQELIIRWEYSTFCDPDVSLWHLCNIFWPPLLP